MIKLNETKNDGGFGMFELDIKSIQDHAEIIASICEEIVDLMHEDSNWGKDYDSDVIDSSYLSNSHGTPSKIASDCFDELENVRLHLADIAEYLGQSGYLNN